MKRSKHFEAAGRSWNVLHSSISPLQIHALRVGTFLLVECLFLCFSHVCLQAEKQHEAAGQHPTRAAAQPPPESPSSAARAVQASPLRCRSPGCGRSIPVPKRCTSKTCSLEVQWLRLVVFPWKINSFSWHLDVSTTEIILKDMCMMPSPCDGDED